MDVFELIGLPYVHKGRDLKGVDCWGLVQVFYREILNIEVPEYLDLYGDAFDAPDVAAAIETGAARHWEERKAPAEFGDVITFRIMGQVCHCGVSLGGRDFIHAFQGTSVCLESLTSITWNKRIAGVYQWKR